MFAISNEHTEGLRDRSNLEQTQKTTLNSIPAPKESTSDATQRVRVDTPGAPSRRQAPQQSVKRPAHSPAHSNADRRRRDAKRKRNTIIALSAVAAVLLIAIIATCAIMFSSTEDDGLILNNVYAAGVNLGGKTPEEAKVLLQEAVANTYSKLDMVVEVHDTRITLKPADTGAKLDVDAVIEAAYNYGRTGSRSERQKAKLQSLTSSYAISVIPYLNLDTDYIRDAVDQLGNKYSSTLSQPQFQVKGERPDLNVIPSQADLETV